MSSLVVPLGKPLTLCCLQRSVLLSEHSKSNILNKLIDLFGEWSDFDLKLADEHEVHVSVGQEEVTVTRSRLHYCLSDSVSHFLFLWFMFSHSTEIHHTVINELSHL